MPGYTRIEDLPELGADEANAFREDFKPRDVQKFIRNNRLIIPSGAGMNNIQEGYNNHPQQQYQPQHHQPPQQQYQPQHHQYNPSHNHPQQQYHQTPQQTHEGYNNKPPQQTHEGYSDEYPHEFIEQPIIKLRERHNSIDPMSISCIDIASHIQNCPICSKFYNGDKSLYIIIIIILAIVSLLLLKRVLGV